jgi:hypothetical protein
VWFDREVLYGKLLTSQSPDHGFMDLDALLTLYYEV